MNAGHKGKPIRFFPIKDSKKFTKHYGKSCICPICLRRINGEIFLVVSNQAGLPNRILHKACVTNEDETIAKLASLYEEAKIMRGQFEQYAHWF